MEASILERVVEMEARLRSNGFNAPVEYGSLKGVCFEAADLLAEIVGSQIGTMASRHSSESHEPYVIHITRREFMDLPLDTRRKIMERQVIALEQALEGEQG